MDIIYNILIPNDLIFWISIDNVETAILLGLRDIDIYNQPALILTPFVLIAGILRRYFYKVDAIKFLLDGTINMIPNLTILLIYCFAVPILLLLKLYVRRILLKQH